MNKFIFGLLVAVFLSLTLMYLYIIFPSSNPSITKHVLDLSKTARHLAKKNKIDINTSSEEINKLVYSNSPESINDLSGYDLSFQPIFVNNTIELSIVVCKKKSFILKDLSTTTNRIDEKVQ